MGKYHLHTSPWKDWQYISCSLPYILFLYMDWYKWDIQWNILNYVAKIAFTQVWAAFLLTNILILVTCYFNKLR